MTVGRVEKLFMSQRRWEGGEVGLHCLDHSDRKRIFEKQQFVLQFYLGFLKINPASRERHFTHTGLKITVPNFEVLNVILVLAWHITSHQKWKFWYHLNRESFPKLQVPEA